MHGKNEKKLYLEIFIYQKKLFILRLTINSERMSK